MSRSFWTRDASKPAGFISLFLPHSSDIDDKFLDAIDLESFVHGFIHVGAYHAGSSGDGFCGQMQVLSDVPGIQIEVAIAALAIAPAGAVGHGGIDEIHGRALDHFLSETAFKDPVLDFRAFIIEDEAVFDGVIVIQPRFQAGNSTDVHKGFNGVAGAGGRHIAEGDLHALV